MLTVVVSDVIQQLELRADLGPSTARKPTATDSDVTSKRRRLVQRTAAAANTAMMKMVRTEHRTGPDGPKRMCVEVVVMQTAVDRRRAADAIDAAAAGRATDFQVQVMMAGCFRCEDGAVDDEHFAGSDRLLRAVVTSDPTVIVIVAWSCFVLAV
jgi:hypothetical protein